MARNLLGNAWLLAGPGFGLSPRLHAGAKAMADGWPVGGSRRPSRHSFHLQPLFQSNGQSHVTRRDGPVVVQENTDTIGGLVGTIGPPSSRRALPARLKAGRGWVDWLEPTSLSSKLTLPPFKLVLPPERLVESSRWGGLLGLNQGNKDVGLGLATISHSYAAGAVGGDFKVGGLVGENPDTVTNWYAAGASTAGWMRRNRDASIPSWSKRLILGGSGKRSRRRRLRCCYRRWECAPYRLLGC